MCGVKVRGYNFELMLKIRVGIFWGDLEIEAMLGKEQHMQKPQGHKNYSHLELVAQVMVGRSRGPTGGTA